MILLKSYIVFRTYTTSGGGSGGGSVDSVNGKTGVVVLDASDVGADTAGSAAAASASANNYTDQEISDLSSVYLGINASAGGDLSGNYPNPAVLNSAVLAKLLTGLNVTGSSIAATDNLLQAFGKLQNQINGVLGGAIYQGTWNATTNSPALSDGTGTKGHYYVVSVAGTRNLGSGNIDFAVGDWAIHNGTIYQKVDNTDAVSSVNGFIGAVNLTSANISEVTNLYFTTARVLATTLSGYVSGAGTVSATDTILQAIQKLNGNIVALASVYQPLDSDLTDIAGLSPSNDDIIQRKSGAWTNRTLAQLRADLNLPQVVRIVSETINNDPTPDTFITATGYDVAIDAGETVMIRYIVPYDSANTGTGARFTHAFSGTLSSFRRKLTMPQSQTTTVVRFDAVETPISSATGSHTTGNIAEIIVYATASVSGTLSLRFASETSSVAITTKAGGTMEIWRY